MPAKFCICGTQCIIPDNKDLNLEYVCPIDNMRYPLTGDFTMLHQANFDIPGLFSSVEKSAAFDPVNLRKAIQCGDCGRPYMTFMQLGKKAMPMLFCKCGAIRKINA